MRFIAVQQFRADSGTGFVTAAMVATGCSMQFVLPNRTPLPATREAGLVQIALLIQDARGKRSCSNKSGVLQLAITPFLHH
jgi:hypothetical protein